MLLIASVCRHSFLMVTTQIAKEQFCRILIFFGEKAPGSNRITRIFKIAFTGENSSRPVAALQNLAQTLSESLYGD